MTDAGFYRAFEDRYRGSRELITERLRVYLPFIEGLKAALPGMGGVDLGCGRGEWLELLASEGFGCRGVDLDKDMLAACVERGLAAEHGDAIVWLQAQADASLALVSAFHLVEHLPFDALHTIVAEAKRVLVPGGLIILETPNPENLAVGTELFYLDPTHVRPVPSALLAFLLEYHGFARVRVLRLQHDPALLSAKWLGARELVEGVSPDYAVISQSDGPEAVHSLFHEAFALQDGVSRTALADRHDRLVTGRFEQIESLIGSDFLASLARRLDEAEARREAGKAKLEELAQRIETLEATAQQAAALASALGEELSSVYGSRSWRATEPLRRLSVLAKKMRGTR